MAKETVYNNTLVSGAADETLTYTRYVKDESSGKSTKELLDEKVNKTDQLGTTQIADKAITTEKLENESVTTDKLDAASVTTDKVADANITTSKLADSSVETEKINNKAVTTDKLNDGAVDNSKLSPNAVTSEKIKDESVITEKLNDRAVTTEKVEEKAITNTKIGDSAVDGRTISEASVEKKHLANDSVATEKVQDSAITSDKIHTDAVTEEKIKDGSVSNSKLADNTISTSKIKDGNITNEKVANNTLTQDKLDPELRKTIQAATGLPENLIEVIQDVDKEVKTLHSKDTDLQSQITDKQQQITAHDKDIELLQTRSTQMEQTINNIAATGGASVANTVAYTNTTSGLESVNAQGAIDELAAKNKLQDATISAKANAEDVSTQMKTEQERVNAEFAKKFDKESILQEVGEATDKVMSQKAVSSKLSDLSNKFYKIKTNNPKIFKDGYYIKTDGTRGDYGVMAIYEPIGVNKGDIISADIDANNNAICPIAFSTNNTADSDLQSEPLATYVETNKYMVIAPDKGFIIVSAKKEVTPKVNILGKYDFEQIQTNKDNIELNKKNISNNKLSLVSLNERVFESEDRSLTVKKHGYYIDTNGKRKDYSQFSIFTPIRVTYGDILSVKGIIANETVCPVAFSFSTNTDSDMNCTPLAIYDADKSEYTINVTSNGYIFVCSETNSLPTVNLLKYKSNKYIPKTILADKSIMLFGDSLVAGSATGIVSFGRIMAEELHVPYRGFVYDRFDKGSDYNSDDVDIDYPCVTNYAKDGTHNAIIEGRNDSILERVKNHININTNVEYVLVECSINDYTSGVKGTITDSYEGEYNVNTAIGALEETCRYLTTLNKDIKVGFLIPWHISYVPSNYFDEHIQVLKKWCVPYLDMRELAGFDMLHCTKHRELYSLPSSSYSIFEETKTYKLDDKVKYNGYLYKCNKDNVVGVLPTDSDYWTKITDGEFDGCHLNNLGHRKVVGKLLGFVKNI